MDKMYPEGRELARTGMRNKLFILHGLIPSSYTIRNQTRLVKILDPNYFQV